MWWSLQSIEERGALFLEKSVVEKKAKLTRRATREAYMRHWMTRILWDVSGEAQRGKLSLVIHVVSRDEEFVSEAQSRVRGMETKKPQRESYSLLGGSRHVYEYGPEVGKGNVNLKY